MDRIREQMNRPVAAAVAGAVLGLIVGLIFAWVIWPVQWTNASAVDMRPDLQRDWLRMTIESYARNQNTQLALQRWQELGDQGPDIFAEVIADPSVDPEDAVLFGNLVNAQIPAAEQQPTAEEGQEATQEAVVPAAPVEEGEGPNLVVWLVVLCVLMLVIGGALFYLLVLRKRPGGMIFTPGRQNVEQSSRPMVEQTDYAAEGQEPPIAQFMTTYVLGEDTYDDSFSIDSPTGEFLGECGVGISDTIGVGDPKKVTAFEVWLFDKNDIQTVTKVLMSDHAYNDPNISQRLMSKGEPVVVEPGQHIVLETATLRLEARVVDMNYGQGALPANSYFDRMTLELAIWQKLA